MDEIKQGLLTEVIKSIEELKLAELKYHILTEYIKSEANAIYFDKDKILKMIEILDGKKIEIKIEVEEGNEKKWIMEDLK